MAYIDQFVYCLVVIYPGFIIAFCGGSHVRFSLVCQKVRILFYLLMHFSQ